MSFALILIYLLIDFAKFFTALVYEFFKSFSFVSWQWVHEYGIINCNTGSQKVTGVNTIMVSSLT